MRLRIEGKVSSIMSGISFGKLVLTTALLASFAVLAPLSATRREFLVGASEDKARKRILQQQQLARDDHQQRVGNKSGKAVTKTEIFVDRNVTPMVSPLSLSAMTNAIARYQDIAAQGGWGTVSNKALGKGDDGEAVVALKRRLIAEGYLSADALSGETAMWFTAAVEKAVAQFQSNNGLAMTGRLDKGTINALNVSVAKRLATMRANLPRLQRIFEGSR